MKGKMALSFPDRYYFETSTTLANRRRKQDTALVDTALKKGETLTLLTDCGYLGPRHDNCPAGPRRGPAFLGADKVPSPDHIFILYIYNSNNAGTRTG